MIALGVSVIATIANLIVVSFDSVRMSVTTGAEVVDSVGFETTYSGKP